MSRLVCKQCGSKLGQEDDHCGACGIPLPPNHATQAQTTFVWWFVMIVIFCFVMMVYLPPDWLNRSGN
ncbi:MAG: DnrP protein [Gammaproteobacteria bacterium]|nr:MAG: DnrP protein [Gammaproteobacteria bacterium]